MREVGSLDGFEAGVSHESPRAWKSKDSAVSVNEVAKEGVEEFGSWEAAIICLYDPPWMTYVSKARVTRHEFIVHVFGARVDDLDVRQIHQEQVVEGLVSLLGNKVFDCLSTRRCLAGGLGRRETP